MDGFGILIFVLFAAIVIAAIIYGTIAARKRREALAALAFRLGLNYRADDDHSLADRFEFLDALARGSNRYAFNTLSGVYQSHEVLVFDSTGMALQDAAAASLIYGRALTLGRGTLVNFGQ